MLHPQHDYKIGIFSPGSRPSTELAKETDSVL